VTDRPPTSGPLEALERLVAYGREEVAPALGDVPDAKTLILAVGLFARGTILAEAIITLGREEFGREVMILNRTLFELMVDIHWIAADPKVAEERFVQYARYDQQIRKEVARRWPDLFPPVPDGDDLPVDEMAEHRKRFDRSMSWTGLNLNKRVNIIANQFPDLGGNHLKATHDIVNRASNAEVHPSPWSLARILRRGENPGGSERYQFRFERESELTDQALHSSCWIYGHLLARAVQSFGIPDDGLKRAERETAQLLGLGLSE
jgi:hypothetical protein